MICVSLPGPSLNDLKKQLRLAETVADLVEFRPDLYDTPYLVRDVRESCKLPFILTYHSKPGQEEEGVKILQSLLPLGPEYVDLDCSVQVQDWPSEIKIIRSHHDFSGTPEDLQSLFDHLTEKPAALYKMATMAQSTLDALRLLHFAKNASKPLVVMAMGEKGRCSRILAPVVGCPFVYASLSEELCTAPGQISAEELRRVYNFKKLDSSTALYGLLGDPIQQSIGHLVHNAYMGDFAALYVKLQIAPEELEATLDRAMKLGFRGFSVTIPHKEAIIPLLDEVDENVRKIGAVNTVTVKEGRLCGSNTDAGGALDALEEVTPVRGKRMVLLGAGGSIRAIAYEAKKRGADVIILNRDVSRAERLAGDFSATSGSLNDLAGISYDILINGTPNQMPIDPSWIKKGATVMDLSITPRETEFLCVAKEHDCRVVYGTDMFFRQAAGQAKAWF